MTKSIKANSIKIEYRRTVDKNPMLVPQYCIVVNKVWVGDLILRPEPEDWMVYLNLDEQRRKRFETKTEAKLWIKNVLTKYLAWRNLVTGPKIIKAHKDYLAAIQ